MLIPTRSNLCTWSVPYYQFLQPNQRELLRRLLKIYFLPKTRAKLVQPILLTLHDILPIIVCLFFYFKELTEPPFFADFSFWVKFVTHIVLLIVERIFNHFAFDRRIFFLLIQLNAASLCIAPGFLVESFVCFYQFQCSLLEVEVVFNNTQWLWR